MTPAARFRWIPCLLVAALLLGACRPSAPAPTEAAPAAPSAAAPVNPTAAAPTPTGAVKPTQPPGAPATQAAPAQAGASPLAVIGMESGLMARSETAAQATGLQAAWMRLDAISWAEIEPAAPGSDGAPTYRWESVDEAAFEQASAAGMQVIATVRYTPAWAQQVPGSLCGPVAPARLDEFARFLGDVVRRYSLPPYNVRYWELGNEPDVEVSTELTNFGCWGDPADEQYFGGDDYAAMLKAVTPAIKAADPQAQVLIGGLLLDCDPSYDESCIPGRFFEGILAGGGADYFDIASFHAYPFFHIPLKPEITNRVHDLDQEKWKHRSGRGVVLGKVDFLREVMAAYDVEKALLLSETALMCADWGNGCTPAPLDEFYEKQADFAVSVYTRSAAENLLGAIWYTLEDSRWRASGLHTDSEPTKGYLALQAWGELLGPTRYFGPVDDYAQQEISGYEFRASEYRIWVLWSMPELDTRITLPPGVLQVYDKYGATIAPAGQEITVNSPVYVKLSLP